MNPLTSVISNTIKPKHWKECCEVCVMNGQTKYYVLLLLGRGSIDGGAASSTVISTREYTGHFGKEVWESTHRKTPGNLSLWVPKSTGFR